VASGSIDGVTLILVYVVVLILVATVLFGLGSVLFGRGERLPPLPRATTATVLPASGVTGADVDAVKFTQSLRGYKTSEVDWVLDRLGQELDLVRGELAAVRAAHGIVEDVYETDDVYETPDEQDDIDDLDALDDVDDEERLQGAHLLSDDGGEHR
jgi:DivIVA domain-containing protein